MHVHDDTEHLWFGDDDPPGGAPRRRGVRRPVWTAVVSVVCVAAISVPVAVALSSNGGHATRPPTANQKGPAPLPNGQAEHEVLSALSATTSSGSFNVTYEFDPATPPTQPTTSTTSPCVILQSPLDSPSGTGGTVAAEQCGSSSSAAPDLMIQGQGTIDTDPFAMVATSDVSGLGMITLRDNGTDVWELGGGDYGLSPGSTDDGPGSSLSGFAGLVEGTLGLRQGALAMGGLSSPTGYLDLDESMITGADQTGTGIVDGVPVTVYEISITPAQEADVPGLNAEEAKAVQAADALLQQQGYIGTTVQVSIDASGYIRQTRSTAHFADGSTSVSQSTFSDFGCAGTVLMPGQTGATGPPAGCVSPDTGVAPVTTTSPSPSATTSTTTWLPTSTAVSSPTTTPAT